MLEISYYFPKSQCRYVLSIGHGGRRYGQVPFVTFIREEYVCGEVRHAEWLWSI